MDRKVTKCWPFPLSSVSKFSGNPRMSSNMDKPANDFLCSLTTGSDPILFSMV